MAFSKWLMIWSTNLYLLILSLTAVLISSSFYLDKSYLNYYHCNFFEITFLIKAIIILINAIKMFVTQLAVCIKKYHQVWA